ncbi:hypothetical protein O7599_08445 [Streptomyces sp. WMMC500]|uniref:hypothetical protein n=1 Tax=Streptomyces sp. WMMC500 TaxID=3015154 RepID=UPI00248BC00D|nr:hypothetical protein [Streptomyces sp. WMMC500]WBB62548.1 hypothetical protein O7599_08445 [Streptomyces sp. WMMC500]
MRMRTVAAAAVLLLTLGACSDDSGGEGSDEAQAACKKATAENLGVAGNAEAARKLVDQTVLPPACEGLDTETVRGIVDEVIEEEYD